MTTVDDNHQVEAVIFDAPGPGAWELDATHSGRRPMSMFVRSTLKPAGEDGMRVLVERYGLPLAGIRLEFVNGCAYMRAVGIGEGSKPKPPPPAPIMKLMVRLHPEMRRRNRTVARAWDEKRWRIEVDRWFDHERPAVVAENLEFQGTDLAELDDAALLAHVAAVLGHFGTQARLNMETHGGDIMPAGDYLAHC